MSVIIRLQKLPLTANASDVRNFFNGLSIPDGGVHIVGGEMGDAFIAFSTDEDARQAMALNGGRINNEPISLLLSSRAEMQKVIDQARKAAVTYMQLNRAVPASAGNGSKPAIPETTAKPSTIAGVSLLGAVQSAGSVLPKFNSPPPVTNPILGLSGTSLKQQPQPPVISLAGFLAKAKSSPLSNTPVLTGASATVSSTFSPFMSQGSSSNEIPGLSFLSSTVGVGNVGTTGPVDTGVPSLSTSGLTGWLSALSGQLKGQDGGCAAAPYLNGAGDRIDTSFLANSVTPLNTTGQLQTTGNNQSPWKFLKKDRSSRSSSRERGYRRNARSRSSSRERDLRRDRRSRSSSRGRSYKRDGRSRSSSRDRGSRSWSRSSSRDYNRRYRNSRSRSSSRDRFGRTRHRSRSRSPRRDQSREPSGSRYDREGRQDFVQNRGRFSHFSGRLSDSSGFSPNNQNQQDQWSTLDKVFTGNSKPVYASGMNRQVEPIFGLHTTPNGPGQDPRSRHALSHGGLGIFPARSGKISPAPSSSLHSGIGGGPFRSMSPLPDSVYSGIQHSGSASNNGPTTSDYAVKVSNMETVTGYGEIRRFFKSLLISTQGIKMINDQNGRRTGVAYIQFLRKEGKRLALMRDGSVMRKLCINIESITDQEFEQAIDSYRPGSDKGYQQQQQQQHQTQQHQNAWNDPGSAPWNANSFRGDSPWSKQPGNDLKTGNEMIESIDDQDAKQKSVVYLPTSALMVWNLPSFTTEQDIMKMFSDFTVVEVLIVRNYNMPKQLDGYVRFHRQEDAKEAWSQLHRHYIGNKKVTVRMCPEIDYAVAKNEYENPSDNSLNTGEVKDRDGQSDRQMKENIQHSESPSVVFGNDRETINRDRGSCEDDNRDNIREGGSNCNERRTLEDDNSISQERNIDGGGSSSSNRCRTKRWDTDTNWNEENDPKSAMIDAQRRMDSDGGAGSDTNASWDDRNSGMDCEGRDMSQTNDSNHFNMNGDNNGPNSRDPRRQSRSRGRSSFGGNSSDNSELFQRTTCLLLRNVDFNVFEEDVFQFFAQDGFRAKSVLLVRNERGNRTGECLVEFESPSAAAHAESKSSQTLGRRKVFASHLDRGQVAELMKRFDAISDNRRSPNWESQRCRDRDDGFREDRDDDPEENQGVGCGPYRTSTVGLLNLAYKTTVEDVQNFFREFELPLENIRRRFLDNGQATGEAMVRFRNHHDAEKALNEYQNRKLFGRNVRIRLINDG